MAGSKGYDQAEIVRFLASGDAFGGDTVEHMETHCSHVFLTGDRAYKLKRDVKYSFLDFSTVEKRHAACETELVLNRRTAPDMYLGLVPLTRDNGAFALNGNGEVIDWLVEMARFRQRDLLVHVAERGELDQSIILPLAEEIMALHGKAEVVRDRGGPQTQIRNAADVGQSLKSAGARLVDPDRARAWDGAIADFYRANVTLMEDRRKAGRVRRCHGDMHLANICLFRGKPTLFDCIEFNEDIACIDVLYDVAFLLMDLLRFDLRGPANRLFNRYLSATRDYGGLPLMPGFLSHRAAIRSMAAVLEPETEDSEQARQRLQAARSHLALALDLLEAPEPRLIAVGGLSGSGKSTLARALAPGLAPGVGAVVISSDVTRKRLHGARPEDRLPPEAYSGEASGRTYARLFGDCAAALAAGQTVIADATFIRPEDRSSIEDVAHDAGVPFAGLWLEAAEETLKERVGGRRGDPSDADRSVIEKQLRERQGAIDWSVLDAQHNDLQLVALKCLKERDG